jgi:anti-sigma B factor antagonist
VTITDEQRGGVAILNLRGSFIGTPGVTMFEKAIYPFLNKEVKWIILDMHLVRAIDSAGLGAIVSAMGSIKQRGGALKLARVNGEIERVVKSMHLDKVFTIYESASAAEESCHTKRET